jgi:hypothetical protein
MDKIGTSLMDLVLVVLSTLLLGPIGLVLALLLIGNAKG